MLFCSFGPSAGAIKWPTFGRWEGILGNRLLQGEDSDNTRSIGGGRPDLRGGVKSFVRALCEVVRLVIGPATACVDSCASPTLPARGSPLVGS